MRQAFVIMVLISGILVGLIFNVNKLSYKVTYKAGYSVGKYMGFVQGCNWIEKELSKNYIKP